MPNPLPELSAAELSRYSRHILLGEIGVEGQRRLAASRILVIGAGGLGSPVSLYLAAAGVGTLGIADLDKVEEHNLQRQFVHDTASIGAQKVTSAAQRLRSLNPHITVVEHPDGITTANAAEIFAGYDVIVDGTDNFSARYLNNDAAFFAGKPLVFGSVFKFEGQVSVFDPAAGGPCYRCLFPDPPAAGSVPGCGEAGVLGALCGVIGSLQALEALKVILHIGEPLRGRLLTYDALTQNFQTLTLKRRPTCALCGSSPAITHLTAVSITCVAPVPPSPFMPSTEFPLEVSVTEARQLLDSRPTSTTLIDVREPWETQICRVEGAELIPMRQIPEQAPTLPKDRHLLIMCHHGARSLQVTQYLRANGFDSVSNIAGGIAAWAEDVDPTLARY
jgi:molybdopterin/thiamine biosynthesis adenylyltransferase/rhodanese-related sulfurtransferase